jgi:nitrogen fixation/metabolism regulation signal transduction histidine kinase
MQTAPAKTPDSGELEHLGRATLQIVHDLKNQLNGLKLYATFLRKRLEREDQPPDERETLAKLIAGLDRAAKDLTALVRYARPLDLRPQPNVDLRRIISSVIADAAEHETGGLPKIKIATHIDGESFSGEFDSAALTAAIKAITDDVRSTIPAKAPQPVSISLSRAHETEAATLEWRGANFSSRGGALMMTDNGGTIHFELARKIIEAHGGTVTCDKDVVRVLLPLTNKKIQDK